MTSATPHPLLRKQSTILTDAVLKQLQNKNDEFSEVIEFCYKLCHIWSERHPERAAEVYDTNLKLFSGGRVFEGIENILKVVNTFHDVMDNVNYEIQDVFIQGTLQNGKVCYLSKFNGDWMKPYYDTPPSTKRESYTMTIVAVVKNKKAVEMTVHSAYITAPALFNAIMTKINSLK